MRDSNRSAKRHPEQSRSWWSRAGVAGFSFFLLKGLLWILAPALVALMR